MRDAAIEAMGLEQVFVLGYAQGYLSYLLEPHDFWMGGYEAASALMGPNFGPYLVDVGAEIARAVVSPGAELAFEAMEPLEPGSALAYDALPVPDHQGSPGLVEQPVVDEHGVLNARWIGGPPEVDLPVVTLEEQTDEGWITSRRGNGAPFDSRGPEMVLRLEPSPPYGEASEARTYSWVLWFGLERAATSDVDALSGTYRLRIDGASSASYELTSSEFQL